jgi:hypothetical protein
MSEPDWLTKPLDWVVERGLRWSFVAKFMSTRVSQAAASIPIIGYALLWSESFELLKLKPFLGSGMWFTTTGRLMSLYLGSIALTLAWLLYLWRCPAMIKRSPDIEDHVLTDIQIRNPATLQQGLDALRPLLFRDPNAAYPVWVEAAPLPLKEVASRYLSPVFGPNPHLDESRGIIARCWFLLHEIKAPAAMTICAGLCVAGAIGVFLPSLEVFLLVIKKVFLPMLNPF